MLERIEDFLWSIVGFVDKCTYPHHHTKEKYRLMARNKYTGAIKHVKDVYLPIRRLDRMLELEYLDIKPETSMNFYTLVKYE